eukprot:gene1312-1457_t
MDEEFKSFLLKAPLKKTSSPAKCSFDYYLESLKDDQRLETLKEDGDPFQKHRRDGQARRSLFPFNILGIDDINIDSENEDYGDGNENFFSEGLDESLLSDFANEISFEDAASSKEDSLKHWFEKATPALKRAGVLNDLTLFFKLVANDNFPLQNISLLLFLDVVRYYGSANVCGMRYREETLLFWMFGYLLFHGKWLRFNRGLKFCRSTLEAEGRRGRFNTEGTTINFAVPANSVIRKGLEKQNNVERHLKTGLIIPMLEIVSNQNISNNEQYVLSFDGKLIRTGLTKNFGDIDMAGQEQKPTLAERVKRLNEDIEQVRELQQELLMLENGTNLGSLDNTTKHSIAEKIRDIVKAVTLRIKEARIGKLNKQFAIKKMIDTVGGERKWRESKLVNAISRAKCELLQINDFIDMALQQNKKACLIARTFTNQGTPQSLLKNDTISARNYMISLKEPKEMSSEEIHPVHVKQGTPEWFALRERAVFTGSTLYRGLGLSKFKDQVSFLKERLEIVDEEQGREKNIRVNAFEAEEEEASTIDAANDEEVVEGDEDDCLENTETSRERLFEWGQNNEKHAVATVISHALPMFYPGSCFVEVGASFINCDITESKLVEVSADGLICSDSVDKVVAKVEIKCPYPPAEGIQGLILRNLILRNF